MKIKITMEVDLVEVDEDSNQRKVSGVDPAEAEMFATCLVESLSTEDGECPEYLCGSDIFVVPTAAKLLSVETIN